MSDIINEKDLFEKLMRLQWLIQRHQLQNRRGRGPFADPTRGQGRVLAILKMQPEISTKDLSYLLDIRQQSLSELLGKLEKAGYITREPSDNDKRVMVVKLTDKGRDARQEKPDFSYPFDCLSPEEQLAFGGYLERVIEKLEADLGVDKKEDMEQWMEKTRSRMGDEAFDHLMAMRGRGGQPSGNAHSHGRPCERGTRGCGRNRSGRPLDRHGDQE
ncbi:MarR family winged helix-turn-helix transcriptional regulator [Diplocloster agilis]|uniref:MarR family winged helix-turn-helix transcriptional regulator n=1 Tax=Diplocloster agilis TaxID=2850323 RepID=UPI000821E093|nr:MULTISPECIES: MarR family transcriptional regulator [Lachnospiraceae]MBU9746673.1 MarR family transcriptional regulator [Diplocloster agilis]MCU6736868.1 MarR family transcriptional regulator [Suonthocola fibrivorans]SCJ94153.1 DNA-binding transcriptional repressor MarR [uncultured Clostridium sp.]